MLLKQIVEGAAIRSGAARMRRAMRGNRSLILAYHNVLPHGVPPCGERSLHISQRAFAEHLDLLVEVADVVPLSRILVAPDGHARRPRVAITWDDAYVGAVTAGVEEVVLRQLPATVFAPPGRLGGETFWWDRLAEVHGGQIPGALRSRALDELSGDEMAISQAFGVMSEPLPKVVRSASEAELLSASRAPGITIGSHSWSHVNLSRVGGDRLKSELTASWHWIRDRVASAIPWLSFPYGLDSEEVHARVSATEYQAACLVSGGWLPTTGSTDPFRVPRLNVPAGLSREGFLLRLSGFWAP